MTKGFIFIGGIIVAALVFGLIFYTSVAPFFHAFSSIG